jgi:hypothetical protein
VGDIVGCVVAGAGVLEKVVDRNDPTDQTFDSMIFMFQLKLRLLSQRFSELRNCIAQSLRCPGQSTNLPLANDNQS